MLIEGIIIVVIGMAIVFLFLSVMILVMYGMKAINRLLPHHPQDELDGSAEKSLEFEAIAIAAAAAKKQRKNKNYGCN